MTRVEVLVIGAGPAAAAACQAAIDQGLRPTVIDLGLEIEPERQAAVLRLGTRPHIEWTAEERRAAAGDMQPSLKGVAVKTVFGSRFPYYDSNAPHAALGLGPSLMGASQALGGFSNVWGAATLPFAAEDLTGWPPGLDLAPGYAQAMRILPLAAHRDDLSSRFPLAGPTVAGIAPGPDVQALADDLERRRDALRKRGLLFGLGRVAVGVPGADAATNSCRHCGFCLHGCPYGLIFNARTFVQQQAAAGRLDYQGGLEAERLVCTTEGVEVLCRRRATGEVVTFAARKVLMAAGVVPTARLVAASLGRDELTLRAKDNCYFLVPFLRFRGARDVRSGGFTLVQGYLQFEPGAISERRINLQVYGYNQLFEDLTDQLFGRLFGSWRWPREQLLSRLMLLQGYLHSDDSPEISLTLRRAPGARYDVQTVAGAQTGARKLVWRSVRGLLRAAGILRGLPVVPLVKIEHAGRGFHFGGTFPMRANPTGEHETDLQGSLASLPNVHLVDASVFPSIPPTTITLAVMANADRITRLALRGAP